MPNVFTNSSSPRVVPRAQSTVFYRPLSVSGVLKITFARKRHARSDSNYAVYFLRGGEEPNYFPTTSMGTVMVLGGMQAVLSQAW